MPEKNIIESLKKEYSAKIKVLEEQVFQLKGTLDSAVKYNTELLERLAGMGKLEAEIVKVKADSEEFRKLNVKKPLSQGNKWQGRVR